MCHDIASKGYEDMFDSVDPDEIWEEGELDSDADKKPGTCRMVQKRKTSS
jgi:hypothetical protein